MYPNQPPTPQAPLPTDYLNQIAPQTPKKPLFTFGIKQLILIGAGLVVLVIILAIVIGSITGSKKDPVEHLAARLTATQAVANDAQANLKSSQLRSANSNLKLYMTNTNRDIVAPLMAVGINSAKISKSITTAESTAALSARLEDARLNAVYDATYAREMAYQLGTTLTLMNQIYKSTGSASLKTFLKSAYTNLQPIQETFSNYSSATDS